MINKMYAIYDEIIEEFNPPFVMKNDKVCVKTIKDYAAKHSEFSLQDKKLYALPYEFDTLTGEILDREDIEDNKELMING